MTYGIKEIEANPFLAVKMINTDLTKGCLKILLGAGISKEFGLPSWTDLMYGCIKEYKKLNENFEAPTYDDFKILDQKKQLKIIDIIEKDDRFLEIVKTSLYNDVKDVNNIFLNNAPGLLAIAAFCLGTTRGKVNHIFTLNYDDILERYFKLLGLRVDSGSNYQRPNRWCDIRIDHIHGIIPQHDELNSEEKIVFSYNSYQNRKIKINEEISSWIHNQLLGFNALYIGLSGDDELLELLYRINYEAKKGKSNVNQYYGYWILTPDAYKDHHSILIDHNICPIPLQPSDIPKFLLECCKQV
ncbi:hypothetical protein EA770_07175 [Acinetobacter baumannii]|nr:hypothetical protein EA770_07175 [Acinetobacter baumannii]